jgi:hypothetical protein
LKTEYTSQSRSIQTILRGLLFDKKVAEAVEPYWSDRGLMESAPANHIAEAAIRHFRDFHEVMEDSDIWFDALAKDARLTGDEYSDTELLWQNAIAGKKKKTKEVIALAEQYFEQVRMRKLITKVENFTEKGLHEQARDLILGYEPLMLKSRGHLHQADEGDMTVIKYLFKPFVAYGYITLLEGHSGTGKTTMLCDLIARITNAWTMPPTDPEENPKKKPKNVLYVTSEDGWRDMTLPRLKAAKADFDRIYCWPPDERKPVFPQDIRLLENKIIANDIRLVIFDPIISFMEDQWSDANSAAHVRRIMDSLNNLAERLNVAIIAVRHFTKNGAGQSAMHRGAGSGAWTQTCRFQFFTAKHPSAVDEYVLVPSKVNTVASMGRYALRYRIDTVPVSSRGSVSHYGHVTWKKVSKDERNKTADDWLNGKATKKDRNPNKVTM